MGRPDVAEALGCSLKVVDVSGNSLVAWTRVIILVWVKFWSLYQWKGWRSYFDWVFHNLSDNIWCWPVGLWFFLLKLVTLVEQKKPTYSSMKVIIYLSPTFFEKRAKSYQGKQLLKYISSTLISTLEFWCSDRDFNMVSEQPSLPGAHLESGFKTKNTSTAKSPGFEGARRAGAC